MDGKEYLTVIFDGHLLNSLIRYQVLDLHCGARLRPVIIVYDNWEVFHTHNDMFYPFVMVLASQIWTSHAGMII